MRLKLILEVFNLDDSILCLETFKAYREYRALGPMNQEEDQKMKELIPGCPMQGQPFDEINMLYPFKIPLKAIVHRLSDADEVFSIGVRYNNSTFVNIIANMDLLERYTTYLGEFIFVVGKIKVKEKQGRKFYDIKPRGWKIVLIGRKEERKKKNSGN